jgi:hypothetical protein
LAFLVSPLPPAVCPRAAFLPQGSLLIAAREALQQVRNREPADSRLRQRGSGIQGRTTDTASSSEEDSSLGGSSSGSGGAYAASSRGLTSFVWESDLDEDESGAGGGAYGSSRDYAAPPVGAAGGFGSGGEGWDKGGGGEGGGGGGGGAQSWDQAGLDSWFGNKVDTGPLLLRKTLAPMKAADVSGGGRSWWADGLASIAPCRDVLCCSRLVQPIWP